MVVRDAAREAAVARRAAHDDAVVGKIGIYEAIDAATGPVRVRARPGPPEHRHGDQSGNGRQDDQPGSHARDGKLKFVCPHGAGAKNFQPASYDAASQILIVPLNEACMDMFPVPGGGGGGGLSSGMNWAFDRFRAATANTAGSTGKRQVANAATRRSGVPRGRVGRFVRSVSARLRPQRQTAVGTTLERRVELEPDDVGLDGQQYITNGRVPRRELCHVPELQNPPGQGRCDLGVRACACVAHLFLRPQAVRPVFCRCTHLMSNPFSVVAAAAIVYLQSHRTPPSRSARAGRPGLQRLVSPAARPDAAATTLHQRFRQQPGRYCIWPHSP